MPDDTGATMSNPNPKEKSPPPPWPFFVHRNGQYCRKIGGKHVYFGTDYQAALRKYYAHLDGPPSSVKETTKKFLASLKALGRSERHINSMEWTLNKLAASVGENRAMRTLKEEDFQQWRVELKATNGPVSLGNHIRRVKAMFNWAADPARNIVTLPPKTCLQLPSKDELRKDRKERGPKMLKQKELRALILNSDPTMRAMILLALNGGLGPQDLALLRTSHIKGKWIVYPRPKTGMDRKFPLWPETCQVLAAIMPTNGDPVVFRTKNGKDWLPKGKAGFDSPISQRFTRLCHGHGFHQPGRGFYSLRHVFATVAVNGTKDRDAVETILGHPHSRESAVHHVR